jgi:hypothetical protein
MSYRETQNTNLEHVFDNGIGCSEQIDTRDASHISFYGPGREVLLPQTWNQHA